MEEAPNNLVSGHDDLNDFVAAIEGETVLAFDVEGVNLSRVGQPTLCAVGINCEGSVRVFLFDISDFAADYRSRQMSTLKKVLEDCTITKIIHDCRQDSDSLNEFCGIRISNVFDTSVYNSQLKMTEKRDNLNNTLTEYGCPISTGRHTKSFYKIRPNYWLERPLTEEHIISATQDVAYLFLLRASIIRRMSGMGAKQELKIRKASDAAISEFREKRFTAFVEVPKKKMWFVIGDGGSTLNRIESDSGASVSWRDSQGFFILASTKANLQAAKQLIKNTANGRKRYYHR